MSNNSGLNKKADGLVDKVAGKAKEALGKATGDKSTEREGKKDQVKGDAKKAVGNVQQNFEDTNRR
ncbi:CsbD family protein [Exiguobacterium sp. s144]|uniref:CsbD family protein n=1 Tax=Exiguobacterium sp. s144 TaxID=2751195 RepID=UPI001BEB7A31|nr:CsbD family protein [Exiguobacterium sp. s144]